VRSLEFLQAPKPNMKIILLITSIITLLTTTGCFFPGGRDGWHHGGRGEVDGTTPVVAVQTPETNAPPLAAAATPEVVAPPVVAAPPATITPVQAIIVP
jgi:hypothetical protein